MNKEENPAKTKYLSNIKEHKPRDYITNTYVKYKHSINNILSLNDNESESSCENKIVTTEHSTTNISNDDIPSIEAVNDNLNDSSTHSNIIDDNLLYMPRITFQFTTPTSIAMTINNHDDENIITSTTSFLTSYSSVFVPSSSPNTFNISSDNYETALALLNTNPSVSCNYNIIPIPKFTLNSLSTECTLTTLDLYISLFDTDVVIDYTQDQPKDINKDLPLTVLNKLYPFQKEGIIKAIEHNCRLLIADEMGVGKTIEALCLCRIYTEDWPVLIICPGSVKYSWRNEIISWVYERKQETYYNDIQIINSTQDKLIKNGSFYIVSYDLLFKVSQKLNQLRKFNFVILDESHFIKNTKTTRAQHSTAFAKQAKRVLLLSGTPLLAKPIELFTTLQCIRPDIFSSLPHYTKRYCQDEEHMLMKRQNFNGSANIKELNLILKKIMIRRLKKDVLKQLPPKRRRKEEVVCDYKLLKLITSSFSLNRNGKPITLNGMSMSDLYKSTAFCKLNGVIAYINDLIESNVKFLVFAHHQFMLDEIEKAVKNKDVGHIRIDGNVCSNKRFEMVKRFQNEDECKVAILSIGAAGTGITLTKASLVVFAELTWTPAVMIQCEDRAHRIGQASECVDVIYLYGKRTLDDYIFKKLEYKVEIVSATVDNKEGLSMEFVNEAKEKEKVVKVEEKIFKVEQKETSDNVVEETKNNKVVDETSDVGVDDVDKKDKSYDDDSEFEWDEHETQPQSKNDVKKIFDCFNERNFDVNKHELNMKRTYIKSDNNKENNNNNNMNRFETLVDRYAYRDKISKFQLLLDY